MFARVLPLVGALILLPVVASSAQRRVEVCHVPPGNPQAFHTITIAEAGVRAHLDHGDLLGPCDDSCATLCDDGNPCTIDDTGDCGSAGCPRTRDPVDCNDGNACTADSCDAASGCVYVPREGAECPVNDTDECTAPRGRCDALGACDAIPLPGCCNTDADCEAVDEDLCTVEACESGRCLTVDRVDCTTDACSVSVCEPGTGGCTEPEPIVCEEALCHESGCDPERGCFSNPIDGCCVDDAECDDGNSCTVDTCRGTAGCASEPCAEGDACQTLIACDPETCAPTLEPVTCTDDGDPCTNESCVEGVGCVSSRIECEAGEVCVDGSCASTESCRDGCAEARGEVFAHCLENPPAVLVCEGTGVDPVRRTCEVQEVQASRTCVYGQDGCFDTATDCRASCEDLFSLVWEDCLRHICVSDPSDPGQGCVAEEALVSCLRSCPGGGGEGCSVHADCDDGDFCTLDRCVEGGECVSSPLPCRAGDVCVEGICESTGPCRASCGEAEGELFASCLQDPPADLVCEGTGVNPVHHTCLVEAQGAFGTCLFGEGGCFDPTTDCPASCEEMAGAVFAHCVGEPRCFEPGLCSGEASAAFVDCFETNCS